MRFRRSANVLSLFAAGLLAGAFAYGFFTVVPAFYEVPLQVHLTYRTALMRHNGIYVQIVMAVSILTPLWWARTMESRAFRWLAFLASCLNVSAFVVTRFGNVPINETIKTWRADPPPAEYARLLRQWVIFNDIRTGAAVISFLCVVVATVLYRERQQPGQAL